MDPDPLNPDQPGEEDAQEPDDGPDEAIDAQVERELRGLGWIILPGILGMAAGALVAMNTAIRAALGVWSPEVTASVIYGAVVGAAIGLGVGVAIWVCFPYKS